MPTTTKGGFVSKNYDRKVANPIPTWVPIALLAVTTAALAVPIVLLKRQRANALANSPPPPRRASTMAGSLTLRHRPTPKPTPTIRATNPKNTEDLGFNGAFYSAKAFGAATLLVTLGASASVWGVQSYLGVRNTEEFTTRMRGMLLEKMPLLSSRIHRLTEEDDPAEGAAVREGWDWDAAQQRLAEAFEKDGFSGWAETALKEVETEGRLERMKRGQDLVNSQSRGGSGP